jgi:hypothetical protein
MTGKRIFPFTVSRGGDQELRGAIWVRFHLWPTGREDDPRYSFNARLRPATETGRRVGELDR